MIKVQQEEKKQDDSVQKMMAMLQIYSGASNLSANAQQGDISMGSENPDMSGSKVNDQNVNQNMAMQRRYNANKFGGYG